MTRESEKHGVKSMIAAFDSDTTSQRHSPGSARSLAVPAAPNQDYERLAQLIRATKDGATRLNHDYETELEAISWGSVLEPSRLANDHSLIETRYIIDRAKNIVSAYRRRSLAQMDAMKSEMNDLDVTKQFKADLINGYQSSELLARSQLKKRWDNEGALVESVKSIADVLEQSESWHVSRNTVTFTRDQDLRRFNSELEHFRALVNRETDMQKEVSEQHDRLLDRLREVLDRI